MAYWLDFVTERFTMKPQRGRINLSYVNDPKLEELMDKQRGQFVWEERLQTVRQIEEHVAEEQYEIYFSTDTLDVLLGCEHRELPPDGVVPVHAPDEGLAGRLSHGDGQRAVTTQGKGAPVPRRPFSCAWRGPGKRRRSGDLRGGEGAFEFEEPALHGEAAGETVEGAVARRRRGGREARGARGWRR
ncbi:hypothetical protein O0235_10620 [Tepidiforma flava]|uniref:Uncharacterized protein n=1 Tax=Tepidiforma flava TaxID=3004094 RepID=A0ABY7M567_9CHLR|nr:hypothetical protein [Tepidiforma flava]WBL35239.1 hypothetical protein O0235_10620 [Tepidiforma flava]